MTTNEHWRAEYRKNRYMEQLSQEALEQRFHDIVSNMLFLTLDGQIGLETIDRTGTIWIQRRTEIAEELAIRNISYQNISPKDGKFPQATWPAIPRVVKDRGRRQFKAGKHLFKYHCHPVKTG